MKQMLEQVHEIEGIIKGANAKGSFSLLERDLVLEKLRQLYDSLLFDKQLPQKEQSKPLPEKPKEEIRKKETTKEEVIEDTTEMEMELQQEQDELVIEEVEEEQYVDVQAEVEEQEEPMPEPPAIPDTRHDKHEAHATPLGEKYLSQKKYRNETLAHNGKKDMASVFQNKPIEDLGKAIGINEKFLFTKELFGGNAELYAKSIKQLNEFADINDALIYIQDNFSWDNDNDAANRLIDLIRRKLLHT